MFFALHDHTSLNCQGADVGAQYKFAIFILTLQQYEQAQTFVASKEVRACFDREVVTIVEPLRHYYQAGHEHQNYFEKHPQQGCCQFVITPKVEKFKQKF